MLIRQTILAAAVFTALLAGCQKKDAPLPETMAPATPAPSLTTPAPAPSTDAAPTAPATEEKK